MNTEVARTFIRILLALLPLQVACVSHQHAPQQAALATSPDCDVVYGRYAVDSDEEGRVLARSLFDSDEVVSTLVIKDMESHIEVRGNLADGQSLPERFFTRYTCVDSVLKVILSDEYSAGGIFANASDQVLELFATDERSVNLRFIRTTLAFVFIVPYYSSSDGLVVLRKQPADPD